MFEECDNGFIWKFKVSFLTTDQNGYKYFHTKRPPRRYVIKNQVTSKRKIIHIKFARGKWNNYFNQLNAKFLTKHILLHGVYLVVELSLNWANLSDRLEIPRHKFLGILRSTYKYVCLSIWIYIRFIEWSFSFAYSTYAGNSHENFPEVCSENGI